jgi:hypothetical protein
VSANSIVPINFKNDTSYFEKFSCGKEFQIFLELWHVGQIVKQQL